MTTNPDVLIIGGGLAGLAGAIHLSGQGLKVMVIEKSGYPRHKVCGEYISNEILPYLKWLGADVGQLHPTIITNFQFSDHAGAMASAKLPLGGFGVSRYALDNLLYQKALINGCTIVEETVTGVLFDNNLFTIVTPTQKIHSKIVLGAYGKRSNIDQVLTRGFMHKKSPWLAVKGHYAGNFPNDIVGLHNFNGGYCGVSKVENDTLNICYLADYATFKQYKNIEVYQREVLYKNPRLKDIFEASSLLFEKQLTISQISFDKKIPVENHMLMLGDTAGLIHPLCGNGMAMAMHSAKIASEVVLGYHSGKIGSRKLLEKAYSRQWKKHFGKRMFIGRMLAGLLKHKQIIKGLLKTVTVLPWLLPLIIKQTHGKPITVSN